MRRQLRRNFAEYKNDSACRSDKANTRIEDRNKIPRNDVILQNENEQSLFHGLGGMDSMDPFGLEGKIIRPLKRLWNTNDTFGDRVCVTSSVTSVGGF